MNGLGFRCGLIVLVLAMVACGPTYVRDTDVEGLDDAAMSTGLIGADLDRLFAENVESLMNSGVSRAWRRRVEYSRHSIGTICKRNLRAH